MSSLCSPPREERPFLSKSLRKQRSRSFLLPGRRHVDLLLRSLSSGCGSAWGSWVSGVLCPLPWSAESLQSAPVVQERELLLRVGPWRAAPKCLSSAFHALNEVWVAGSVRQRMWVGSGGEGRVGSDLWLLSVWKMGSRRHLPLAFPFSLLALGSGSCPGSVLLALPHLAVTVLRGSPSCRAGRGRAGPRHGPQLPDLWPPGPSSLAQACWVSCHAVNSR